MIIFVVICCTYFIKQQNKILSGINKLIQDNNNSIQIMHMNQYYLNSQIMENKDSIFDLRKQQHLFENRMNHHFSQFQTKCEQQQHKILGDVRKYISASRGASQSIKIPKQTQFAQRNFKTQVQPRPQEAKTCRYELERIENNKQLDVLKLQMIHAKFAQEDPANNNLPFKKQIPAYTISETSYFPQIKPQNRPLTRSASFHKNAQIFFK